MMKTATIWCSGCSTDRCNVNDRSILKVSDARNQSIRENMCVACHVEQQYNREGSGNNEQIVEQQHNKRFDVRTTTHKTKTSTITAATTTTTSIPMAT